ncbi:MAG: ATP-dependent DNA ligase [Ornithinimicrobium sp.]
MWPDLVGQDGLVDLSRVIETSTVVAGTRSRTAKVEALAQTLRDAADESSRIEPDETVEVVTDYLSGRLPQRRIGVSWRGLQDLPAPAGEASLTVLATHQALDRIAQVAGIGSAGLRRGAIDALMGRATKQEQRWLASLITGEMRQGASDGVMLQAIARAAGVDDSVVRAAVMRAGFAGPVAQGALAAPTPDAAVAALVAIDLHVGRPLRPMLAGSAPSVAQALSGVVAVERKLDGIRIQAHITAAANPRLVSIFTRTLEDITDRVPEVVQALGALPVDAAVLDGEILVLRSDGRPAPFQVTGARTASSADPERLMVEAPLTTYLFDAMHIDGVDLLDTQAAKRWDRLAAVAPDLLVPRVVTDDVEAAQEFFKAQIAAGHEGVILKALDAPYAAGRRGAGWVKVKPRYTFDLVVTGVEWGSGRRRGLLSNIHLAARDNSTGDLVMLGKTFKGMTDEILTWQTARFLELEVERKGQLVVVRPEQVVEVAIDGVQRSTRYPGGIALRFARVLRYREDKGASDIDTLEHVIDTCGGIFDGS